MSPVRLLASLAFAILALASGTAAAADPEVTLIKAPDGVPLCVAEGGNPRGRAIVFVHGYSQTYGVFARQFSSDLAREFRLLALDMRGHGCSGKPWDESAYLGSRPWADDIATVLRAKQADRPVLVGWSAGGFWIADYVREHGIDAVAGLVFTGSHAGLMPADIDPTLAGKSTVMRAANLSYPPAIGEALTRAEQFVALMSAQPLPEDLGRIMSAGTLMLPAYARRAMANRKLENADLIPRLELPVLLILGDTDRMATPEQMRKLVGRLPSAQLAIYPGTGHSAFAEQPERFNRDVADFVRRIGSPASP
jgi:pimeloyl-ACP methyl ester carboxylesterase